MNKYILKAFEINVFTSKERPMGKEAIGNPVTVCIVDNLLREDLMEEISIRLGAPITTFVEKRKDEENSFNIRYFAGNGIEVNVCGHATFGTTKVILSELGVKENCKITYIPNEEKFDVMKGQKLDAIIRNNEITISVPELRVEKIADPKLIELLCEILGIGENDIEYACRGDLDDYILELANASILRKVSPNIDIMKKIRLDNGSMLRTIMITAKSDVEGYDYQSRVFAPNIAADEDIACGSANCYVVPYWNSKGLGDSFKMFYPYTVEKNGKLGGVQSLKYDFIEKRIYITSEAEFKKVYKIYYNKKSVIDIVNDNVLSISQ